MKQLTSYNRVAGYLNKLFDLLNQRFFESALSRPTITIQSTPRAYGHFSMRDDTWVSVTGSSNEINIGAGTLARPSENKVGTVANSCSTMHKIAAKEFTLDDFSHEHLVDDLDVRIEIGGTDHRDTGPMEVLGMTIDVLNHYREKYLAATKTEEYTGLPAKDIWWQMIQLLPSSYNQKRTVMLNYEVLANIYKSRRHHKLDEWHTLCDRIESLPYSALITGTAV